MNKNPAVRMSGLHNFRAGGRRVHQRICTIIRQRAPTRGHEDSHTQEEALDALNEITRKRRGAHRRARRRERRRSGRARSKARRRVRGRERTSDERTGAPRQADTGAPPRFPHRPPPCEDPPTTRRTSAGRFSFRRSVAHLRQKAGLGFFGQTVRATFRTDRERIFGTEAVGIFNMRTGRAFRHKDGALCVLHPSPPRAVPPTLP